jgi:DNA-binding transcriptional LysR family regulator
VADLLSLFRTFVRTVEAGSFTAVARDLRSSQPTVSRQIALLEERLGCRLLHRTTRALTPTDDGRVLYEQAQRALEAVEEAVSAVGRRRAGPAGRLRLGCAVVFGRLHLIPRLHRFLERHPAVEVDLAMSDAFVPLVEQGIDLAVRIGEPSDPGLVARRIGLSRRVVVATPGYLARRGTPHHPDQLAGHDCVVYEGLAGGAVWSFEGPAGHCAVPIRGRFRVDNSEGVRAAVLAGLGIGYVPAWHFVEQEIDRGLLVPLLEGFTPPPAPISAVYPSRRLLASKVRAMIDFLIEELSSDPVCGAPTRAADAGAAIAGTPAGG